jgi:putative ABC transport system permease protein
MWRATLKGLLAHKFRLLSTSIAVILGVAFVAGSFILTDTLSHTFDAIFSEANAGTDVVVRAKAAFTDVTEGPGSGATRIRERIPESLLTEVRAVDGVRAAAGGLTGFAQVIDEEGDAVQGLPGAPSLGVGWADDPELNPLRLRDGGPPRADGEMVIDAATAKDNGIQVGDRLRVVFEGPAEEFTVVGIVGFGDADNLGGATLVSFDVRAAQRVFDADGTFDEIAVAAEEGTSVDTVRNGIEAILPDTVEVISAKDAAEEAAQQIQEGLSFFNIALLVFAGVALFVGAFSIFNTFQIIVSQRTRELALLRALGASRGQVLRSVMVEAVLLGLLFSLVGLVAGFGIAIGLQALLKAFGLELPSSSTQFLPRTVIASLVVGVLTTFVASVFPALRASRVPPMAALRDAGPAAYLFSRSRLLTGAAVTLGGGALLLVGLFRGGSNAAAMVGIGAMTTFLGVAILSSLVARPLAGAIGAPLARVFGQPGKLGRENAKRNPKRTAATAAALMIGLALVAFVSIFAQSLKVSSARTLDEVLKADFIVNTEQFAPFTPQAARDLRELPEVSAVADFRVGVLQFRQETKDVSGVDPTVLQDVVEIDLQQGSVQDIAGGGVLVFEDEAERYGFEVGEKIPVRFSRTGDRELRIAGIFRENRLVGNYLMSAEDFGENFTSGLSIVALARIAPGVDPDDARTAVERVLDGYPNLGLTDQTEFKQQQEDQINQLLGLISALLALALIIAFTGIANTLALSVFERTREIGVLRAVGMSRGQVRSMIRWEAVIVTVFGAVLGTAVGVFFGWALVAALKDQGITDLAVPGGQLVVYVIVAALLSLVAAILPARRAARLDVLAAIATE